MLQLRRFKVWEGTSESKAVAGASRLRPKPSQQYERDSPGTTLRVVESVISGRTVGWRERAP